MADDPNSFEGGSEDETKEHTNKSPGSGLKLKVSSMISAKPSHVASTEAHNIKSGHVLSFSSVVDMKRATIELTKRTKSKIMNREDYSYVSPQPLRWGSDTALNVDKDDVVKCSSDQDLEGTVAAAADVDHDPPIHKLTIKKTASIMNVSKMNVFEDMSPRERLYATLVDFDSKDVDSGTVGTNNMGSGSQFSGGHGGGSGGGGGDDDDDDGGDDDFDDGDDDDANREGEVQTFGEDDNHATDESDNETDLVVLDPDHPLMKRFQAALKAHLTKQDDKMTLEYRDLSETLKMKKKEREDIGVELYGVQQELARYQLMLEEKHDHVAQIKQNRQKQEQDLTDVQSMYKQLQNNVNKERKKGSELQSEVENLALRLYYLASAKDNVRSDISVMRRAAEKVEAEVAKAEQEKQRQDLYVDRLVEGVDRLKEEIAMYEAQINAQSEETKAAKESLLEAYMEIEAINLEKKDLYQKWNSSLIGMRRRDEAHSAMMDALGQQEQYILTLATEIEGYKKSIQKEQEQNEKLTHILNKTEREIEGAKKHRAQVQAKQDALMSEYTTYTRMLQETEQALGRAMADKALRCAEVATLRKQIEQEHLAKAKLEDEILERMRAQLTLDKATYYSKNLIKKTRDATKRLETEIADVENSIAQATLEAVTIKSRSERLKKVLDGLEKQISEQNAIINKSEQEIVKRNAVIERKQNQVDSMNKKLTQMIAAAGGVELGPLEIQVNSLVKSIEARNQEVLDLQQLWLRQQTELVRLCQTKDKEMQELVASRRELTILSQKKIRTENDIEQQHREMCEIERSVRNMRNDIIKLNGLLHKEKCIGEELEQGNILMENAFIANLQTSELESIQLQAKLDDIKDEKERLLNSLVQAERQIMLWEKKTQLARETRAAVDSEVGQGEMKAMRSEIHRMQVRFGQLMKQQEKMIQDMEKSVSRRDTIVTQGDALSKQKKKVVTKGNFERQMMEMKKKIKQTIQEANDCDNEIKELRDHQLLISQQLEEKQVNCQQLQSASDTLDGDVERTMEIKHRNMNELLARQQKMKYYQQVKDGKYTMMCRSSSALELEARKQEERIQALSAIVDKLNSEFPHAQPALRKASVALASRQSPDDA
ncbi:coiled-coil domain-containing protein 40-like isoform X2 [Physella acuta]|uniref:coiled-coil domain-containing protein 40-like isoform X2 n=1 Tax=Physella acuta TaxID=109671 RepID=UPI0027DBEEB9|nr:coiled-coil domain-containing protein 40-like isoform X2 [Physella acuta]